MLAESQDISVDLTVTQRLLDESGSVEVDVAMYLSLSLLTARNELQIIRPSEVWRSISHGQTRTLTQPSSPLAVPGIARSGLSEAYAFHSAGVLGWALVDIVRVLMEGER